MSFVLIEEQIRGSKTKIKCFYDYSPEPMIKTLLSKITEDENENYLFFLKRYLIDGKGLLFIGEISQNFDGNYYSISGNHGGFLYTRDLKDAKSFKEVLTMKIKDK